MPRKYDPWRYDKRRSYASPDPEEKDSSLLLPILYALLASVILFLLVTVAGVISTYNAEPAPTREPYTPYIAPTSSPKPSPSPSPTPAPTPTPSPTPEPTESADPEPTESEVDASASPEPSASAEPSPSPSPSPSPEPSPTPTPSPSPTPAPTPTPTPEPTPPPTPSPAQTTARWVLDTYSMIIHTPSCSKVQLIAAQNYATTNSSEYFLFSQGYAACPLCH